MIVQMQNSQYNLQAIVAHTSLHNMTHIMSHVVSYIRNKACLFCKRCQKENLVLHFMQKVRKMLLRILEKI